MSALTVEEVTRSFGGNMALGGVSLAVDPGELLAVIGPNGAGKSTLFNVITGMTPATSGRILVDGADVTEWLPHRTAQHGVARTLQTPRLFPDLTILENVMVALDATSKIGWLRCIVSQRRVQTEERSIRQNAMNLLRDAELVHLAEQMPSALPFGMLQRIEVVRALARRPHVLLLDEPGADLSGSELDYLVATIERACSDGVAVLWIEHHLDLVLRVAPRIHVIDKGISLVEGTPHEIQTNTRVQEAYIGAPVDA